jgi:hypothetical protein
MIHENKLRLIRKFLYFMIGSNFFYQVLSLNKLVNPSIKEHWIIQGFYWLIWTIMLIMVVISKVKDNISLIQPTLILLLIRNVIPMLDFDRKRDSMEPSSLNMFIILQVQTNTIIIVCINFISSKSKAI